MALGIVRLVLIVFPQNDWGNIVPPFEWAFVRNIPLVIMGVATAYFMIRDGFKNQDARFKNFGYCIVVSYAFYIPVILLVQTIPIIGMLMIPKTLAYMVMAFLAYRYYYKIPI